MVEGYGQKCIGRGGGETSFWYDEWVGNETLKSAFPILFHLRVTLGIWMSGRWVCKEMWKTELVEREVEKTNEFTNLINRVTLKKGVKDTWRWKMEKDKNFRTKITYYSVYFGSVRPTSSSTTKHFDMVWSKFIPLKVAATGWRALWNRLPTKDNLLKHEIQILVEELK